MKCIVDTSVWSLALRRKKSAVFNELPVRKLQKLIDSGESVFLLGTILQEILQGIKEHEQFVSVLKALSYFQLIVTDRDDYVAAAELYNKCRSKGVQASTVDFLIASVAIRNDCALLTTDRDFDHIAKHSKLQLI